ncbi:MAG: heme exporter protein CcmD, partial [Gammaproteobacteria bacterium HGW-Gammaproteobacteria-8]
MIPELSHAGYVWSSYAIFTVVLAWQFLQPLLKRKKLLTQLTEAVAERRAARR